VCEKNINKLKNLKKYDRMNQEIEALLKDIGFEIRKGRHHKAVFVSDDRYVISIPKTPSDHRVGKNLDGEIRKRIF